MICYANVNFSKQRAIDGRDGRALPFKEGKLHLYYVCLEDLISIDYPGMARLVQIYSRKCSSPSLPLSFKTTVITSAKYGELYLGLFRSLKYRSTYQLNEILHNDTCLYDF